MPYMDPMVYTNELNYRMHVSNKIRRNICIYIYWKITPKSIGLFGSKNKKTHTLPQTHRASTKTKKSKKAKESPTKLLLISTEASPRTNKAQPLLESKWLLERPQFFSTQIKWSQQKKHTKIAGIGPTSSFTTAKWCFFCPEETAF